MKTKSKKYALSYLLTPLIAIFMGSMASAAPDDAKTVRDDRSIQVAKAWLTSLTQGDTAKVVSLSDVPFDLDGRQEIATMDDLKKQYEKTVQEKGKWDLKITSATVSLSTPEKVIVSIAIEGEDDTVMFTVKLGDTFLVIGCKD